MYIMVELSVTLPKAETPYDRKSKDQVERTDSLHRDIRSHMSNKKRNNFSSDRKYLSLY